MTNKGKNLPAQSFAEMVEDGEQQRRTSKLYKAESAAFVDERLSDLLKRTTAELAEAATTEPVSLQSTADVKARTILYLRACEAASCFPSFAGLARSMGLSRQALYDCIWRKSPPATAAWLEICRDCFSDILAESALRNNCNSIVSIFLQKAVYGLRETTTIELTQSASNGLLDPVTDAEERHRRIESAVVDDE